MNRDEVKALLEAHEAEGLLWSSLAAFPFGILCGFAGALFALSYRGLL